jgi:hypothetical protein
VSDEGRGGGGLSAAFVLLIVVGAIAEFIWWVAAAIAAMLLFGLLAWLAFYAARRVDARESGRLAVAARADEQHAWVLAGDDRGIYGNHPPVV